jgi:glycogen debranching enzyme
MISTTKYIGLSILIFVVIMNQMNCRNYIHQNQPKLSIHFNNDAKLEVGGPFVGVEFHHSYIAPQRISFFYPVANSIDNSRDYWTRDTSHVMQLRLKIDDGEWEEFGKITAAFELTPYSVHFYNEDVQKSITATYQFCDDKSAMVITYTLTNRTQKPAQFSFETRLTLAVKTCHTYKLVDRAMMEFETSTQTIYAFFSDPDADSAAVFVTNSAGQPVAYNCDASQTIEDASEQNSSLHNSSEDILTPVAQFRYEQELLPGAEMQVVQIVGSCRQEEARELVAYLNTNYQQEIKDLETRVETKAFGSSIFQTPNSSTNHSAAYAKAVIAANAHYLDGEVVPMPCPAEYNFYFTHDALVTDLAAVNFDLGRVKRDLQYIIAHADTQKIIPHAYYWKDGRYQTEYASADNWNNFWFIIVTAAYLRHSDDLDLLQSLYPYLIVSLERAMLTKEADNLMWSYRPDWWDIGNNYGPRAYMTILAIKALRDYVYISTRLNLELHRLDELESRADTMENALSKKLWSDKYEFFMNYLEDGSLDPHYYIGPLLGSHYCDLEPESLTRMIETARKNMLDEKVGIYNAYPMDFLNYRDLLRFGDEVGQPNYYFNGGIWPQGNAWYALALMKTGNRQEAHQFIEKVMSLQGIMQGPKGQPAYYEVRNPDASNPQVYGTVDKPQFLWAGAWYLYCLYALYGVDENSWNISLQPYLPSEQKSVAFDLSYQGANTRVKTNGSGQFIRQISMDGEPVNSAVLSANADPIQTIEIQLGEKPHEPYLLQTNSRLQHCEYQSGQLTIEIQAFPKHRNRTVLISPDPPKSINFDGVTIEHWQTDMIRNTTYRTQIEGIHKESNARFVIQY